MPTRSLPFASPRSLNGNLIDCEYLGCTERAVARVRWTRQDAASPAPVCLEHEALVRQVTASAFQRGQYVRHVRDRRGKEGIRVARLDDGRRAG